MSNAYDLYEQASDAPAWFWQAWRDGAIAGGATPAHVADHERFMRSDEAVGWYRANIRKAPPQPRR